MKKEAYVNHIVRKLKCSGKRREEVKRQLLSDISCREETGERLEEILTDIGKPEEFAREFNQNLPIEERRRHIIKKVCIIVAIILLFFAILAGIGFWIVPKGYPMGHSGFFSQDEVEEQAKEVIRLLEEEEYEALKEMSVEELWDLFAPEAMDSVKKQICGDWGALEDFGNVYAQEIKQMGKCYALVQVHVAYEKASILYTLSFTPEGKLAGLYMK